MDMIHDVPTARPYHPERPPFEFHAYGVELTRLVDGDMAAHGHVAPRRFIAAANRLNRTEAGLINITDDPMTSYTDMRNLVAHLYAIRLPKCDCTPEHLAEWGCDKEHDPDPDPAMWGLAYVPADTPGAFPITVGDFSDAF